VTCQRTTGAIPAVRIGAFALDRLGRDRRHFAASNRLCGLRRGLNDRDRGSIIRRLASGIEGDRKAIRRFVCAFHVEAAIDFWPRQREGAAEIDLSRSPLHFVLSLPMTSMEVSIM
jgi:hypothetical protein